MKGCVCFELLRYTRYNLVTTSLAMIADLVLLMFVLQSPVSWLYTLLLYSSCVSLAQNLNQVDPSSE